MKIDTPFDATPEFQHFKEIMTRLITVPKVELDKLVKEYDRGSKRKRTQRAGAASKRIKK